MGHVIQKTPFRTTRHLALMLMRLVADKMKPVLAQLPPGTMAQDALGPANSMFTRAYHVKCPLGNGDALSIVWAWVEAQEGHYFSMSYVLDESKGSGLQVDMQPLYVLKFEFAPPPLSDVTYLETTADLLVENFERFFSNEGLIPALALGKGFKGPEPVDMSFLEDLGPEPQPA